MKFRWIIILHAFIWMNHAEAQRCPKRNIMARLIFGQTCPEPCSPVNPQCKSGYVCECFKECGYSCLPREKLNCYSGVKLEIPGMYHDALSIVQCPPGSKCLGVQASASIRLLSISGFVAGGQCVDSSICENDLNCQNLQNFPQNQAMIKIIHCQVKCCDEDHCNYPTPPTTQPSIYASRTTTLPTLKGKINCHVGRKVTSPGQNQDTRRTAQCGLGRYCFNFSASLKSAISETGSGGTVWIGECTTFTECSVLTCNSMRNLLRSLPIDTEKCSARCCAEDLCNAPPEPPSLPSALQTSVCGYNMTVSNNPQHFDYPFGEGNYSSNASCLWVIKSVTPGHKIQIYFESVDTQECCDSLTIWENGEKMHTYKGRNRMLKTFTSKEDQVTLHFQSDSSITGTGFQATISTIPSDKPGPSVLAPGTSDKHACVFNISITDVAQKLKFPPEGMTYSNGIDCEWTLTTRKPGDRVRIDVESLNTELCCDYFSIIEDGKVVGRFSGEYSPGPSYTSSKESVVLKFHSDYSVTASGFNIQLFETSAPQPPSHVFRTAHTCGTTVIVDGIPQPFNYPGGGRNYSNNIYCKWTLKSSSPGHRLQLHFDSFHTESCCDFLLIVQKDSEPISLRGDIKTPYTFTSVENEVDLLFNSDATVTGSGFEATLIDIPQNKPVPEGITPENTIASTCGSNITITNMPQSYNLSVGVKNYSNSLDCEWVLTTSKPSGIIEIKFEYFNTEYCCDYLSIMENGKEVKRYRGNLEPAPNFTSTTGRIVIRFHSDYSVTKQTFIASIKETKPTKVTTVAPSTPYECGSPVKIGAKPVFLNYPFSNETNKTITSCQLTLNSSEPGKRIQLYFEWHSIKSLHDFLTIRENGENVMNLWNNSDNSRTFTSNTNTVQLLFRLNLTNDIQDFGAVAVVLPTNKPVPHPGSVNDHKTPSCGFNITSSSESQSVALPSGGGNYSNNMDCKWVITTDTPGNVIRLQFESFNTEYCCDYLSILDGGKIVESYRGHLDLPPTYVSKTGQITLYFHSDYSVTKPGFVTIVISEESAAEELKPRTYPCGSILRLDTTPQAFDYPGGNANYENNVHCKWSLRAKTPGYKVQVIFESLETQGCCDFMTAWQNGIATNRLSGNLKSPRNFVSLGYKVDFWFSTDGSITSKGFKAVMVEVPPNKTSTARSWESASIPCGSTITASPNTTQLNVPENGSDYSNNVNCNWVIKASTPSNRIKLDFLAFNTEKCCDYISITENYRVVQRYSGNLDPPPSFISNTGTVELKFTTDYEVTESGFKVLISETSDFPPSAMLSDSHPCKSTIPIYSVPRPFVFPHGSKHYSNNVNCEWTLQSSSPGHKIQIYFDAFHTQLCCDYLTIWENGRRIRRLSGQQLNVTTSTFVSTTNRVDLFFHSDANVTRTGFDAMLVAIPSDKPAPASQPSAPSGSCIANLTVGSSAVSFNFPLSGGNYLNYVDCEWIITTKNPGKVIFLDFESFNIEYCCDFLSIIEDKTVVRRLRGKLDPPPKFSSTTRRIVIRFHSDYSVTRGGFKAKIQEIKSTRDDKQESKPHACGTIISVDSEPRTFKYPFENVKYPSLTNCEWIIKTILPGHGIEMYFESFETESCCDYLSIWESGKRVKRLKGRPSLPQLFYSKKSRIDLWFHSDSATAGRGFEALIVAIPPNKPIPSSASPEKTRSCGFNVTTSTSSEVIKLPASEKHYANDLYCEWTISATTPGRKVRLDFRKFNTEHCCDFLAIKENGKVVKRFRGNLNFPPSFTSTGENITIQFHSDYSINDSGFELSYFDASASSHSSLERVEGKSCGSTITISNIPHILYFPSSSDESLVDCNLTLTTSAPGQRIQLYFTWPGKVEESEFINILEDSQVVTKYVSATNTSRTYVSTDGTLTLRFHLDAKFNKKEFRTLAVAVPLTKYTPESESTTDLLSSEKPSCGSQVTLSSSSRVLKLPPGNGNYSNYLNCEWTIRTANPENIIELDIKSFSTEYCCDFLSIIENGRIVSELRGDKDIRKNFVSTTREVKLRFHSDYSVTSSGFHINVSESNSAQPSSEAPRTYPCKSTIKLGRKIQSFVYPGGSKNYSNSVLCHWHIETETPGYVIQMYFVWLDTQPNYDTLSIWESGLRVRRMSGDAVDIKTFFSRTNQIELWFRSDESITGKGFRLELVAIPKEKTASESSVSSSTTDECINTITSSIKPQLLEFPSGGGNYSNNIDCVWYIITTVPENKIRLNFESFRTEHCCDFLTVSEGYRLLRRYRGQIPDNTSVVSKYRSFKLRFYSDYSITNIGFNVTIVSEAPPLISPRSGTISPPVPKKNPTLNKCGSTINVTTSPQPFHIPPRPENTSSDCGIILKAASQMLKIQFHFQWKGPLYWEKFLTILENGEKPRKLVGHNRDRTFVSNSHTVQLLFKWAGLSPIRQFESTVVAVSSEKPSPTIQDFDKPITESCGSNITLNGAAETIQFPESKTNYSNLLGCKWMITTKTPGKRIRLNITSFDSEYCCDSLVVKENGKKFHEFRGQIDPGTSIISKTNTIVLRFHTDHSLSGAGFEATVSEVPFPQQRQLQSTAYKCGSTINVTTSPQPFHIPARPENTSSDCGIILKAASQMLKIQFHFQWKGPLYWEKFLTILENGEKPRKLVGHNRDRTFVSNSHTVQLLFKWAGLSPIRQFESTVVAVSSEKPSPTIQDFDKPIKESCGSNITLNGAAETIQFPESKTNYSNLLGCKWMITTKTPGKRIRLNITSFDSEYCCDSLVVKENGKKVHEFRGQIDPGTSIISKTNTIVLRFHTDHSLSGAGFEATVSEVPFPQQRQLQSTAYKCGSTINVTTSPQPFHIPARPENTSSDCGIILKAASQMLKIQFHFQWKGPLYWEKFLTILENGEKPRKLVGHNRDRTFVSNSHTVQLLFKWAGLSPIRQFESTVVAVSSEKPSPTIQDFDKPIKESCGSNITLNGAAETIQFPESKTNYSNLLGCKWMITTKTPGKRIRLNITSFDSEYCCDSLVVKENGKKVHEFRGQIDPGTSIISKTNTIVLRFHTDHSVSGAGFEATVSVPSSSSCGSNLIATRADKRIDIPISGGNYSNNLNCTWRIKARTPGYTIQIKFQSFDTEECCDLVLIYENGTLSQRYGGKLVPPPAFNSTEGSILMQFKSDYSNTDRGFRATYSEIPAPKVREDKHLCGRYWAPTTPIRFKYTAGSGNHQNTVKCTWEIRTRSPKHILHINFTSFNTEEKFDLVTILVDGQNPITLSGNLVPPPTYTIPTGYAKLFFASNHSGTGSGFDALLYETKGANSKKPREHTSRTKDPRDRTKDPRDRTKDPRDRTKDPRDRTKDPRDRTKDSRDRTKDPRDRTRHVEDHCREEFRLDSRPQKLKFPTTNGNYSNNVECEWTLIRRSRKGVITINFLSFDTEQCCDYLTIDEGANVLRRLAGNPGKIPPFTSSAKRVYLRFYSSDAITGSGFTVEMTST